MGYSLKAVRAILKAQTGEIFRAVRDLHLQIKRRREGERVLEWEFTDWQVQEIRKKLSGDFESVDFLEWGVGEVQEGEANITEEAARVELARLKGAEAPTRVNHYNGEEPQEIR